MGWLYMQSFSGHSGPRQYLDAQFTHNEPGLRSRVVKSTLTPDTRVYYAAVEHSHPDGLREVFAAVCLVNWNPRDPQGYVFGYKDMTEQMGPVESTCPEAILDLLTPTTNAYALAWRERCRANAQARRTCASSRGG